MKLFNFLQSFHWWRPTYFLPNCLINLVDVPVCCSRNKWGQSWDVLSGRDHYHSSLFASHANECELRARQCPVPVPPRSSTGNFILYISPIKLDKGRWDKTSNVCDAKTNRKMGTSCKSSLKITTECCLSHLSLLSTKQNPIRFREKWLFQTCRTMVDISIICNNYWPWLGHCLSHLLSQLNSSPPVGQSIVPYDDEMMRIA